MIFSEEIFKLREYKIGIKKLKLIEHTTRSFVFWMIVLLIEHEKYTNASLISFTTYDFFHSCLRQLHQQHGRLHNMS